MYSYKYISDSLLKSITHIPLLKIWRNLEKIKLNEPGRQKLGRHRSPVSRHGIHSYIMTYYRLRTRELLIALGSHQRGPLISASAVPHHGVGTVLNTPGIILKES